MSFQVVSLQGYVFLGCVLTQCIYSILLILILIELLDSIVTYTCLKNHAYTDSKNRYLYIWGIAGEILVLIQHYFSGPLKKEARESNIPTKKSVVVKGKICDENIFQSV